MLDTGATITAISRSVVDALGLAPDSWHPVTSVHGTVDAPIYTVKLGVSITEPVSSPEGEALHTFSRAATLHAALLGIESDAFDVLLGMDLLEGFHLTIHAGRFILSN